MHIFECVCVQFNAICKPQSATWKCWNGAQLTNELSANFVEKQWHNHNSIVFFIPLFILFLKQSHTIELGIVITISWAARQCCRANTHTHKVKHGRAQLNLTKTSKDWHENGEHKRKFTKSFKRNAEKTRLYHSNKMVRIDSKEWMSKSKRECYGKINSLGRQVVYVAIKDASQTNAQQIPGFNLTDVDHLYVNHLFVMLLLRFFYSLAPPIFSIHFYFYFGFYSVVVLFILSFFLQMVLWLFASVVTFVRFAETNATACKKKMLRTKEQSASKWRLDDKKSQLQSIWVYSCWKNMHAAERVYTISDSKSPNEYYFQVCSFVRNMYKCIFLCGFVIYCKFSVFSCYFFFFLVVVFYSSSSFPTHRKTHSFSVNIFAAVVLYCFVIIIWLLFLFLWNYIRV